MSNVAKHDLGNVKKIIPTVDPFHLNHAVIEVSQKFIIESSFIREM